MSHASKILHTFKHSHSLDPALETHSLINIGLGSAQSLRLLLGTTSIDYSMKPFCGRLFSGCSGNTSGASSAWRQVSEPADLKSTRSLALY